MAGYLLKLLKTLTIGFALLLAAFLLFVYTRPVHVSAAQPTQDNARLRDDLFRSKKILFVGAHPDDIEFYSAGLIQQLLKHGTDVVYAVGTRGGKGRTGRAKTRLEGRRTHDQLVAARIVGGARVVFYDYPDKDLPSHMRSFAIDLQRLIEKEKPDVVFSWDPDYIYNPHPDHVAAAQAGEIAARVTDVRKCFYGTRRPNLWIGYGEDVFRVKLKSLKAHTTETPWPYFLLGRRYLSRKSMGEGSKIGQKYAEVFRCVD